jgi:sodium-coupled neutral amino acid transporter 11
MPLLLGLLDASNARRSIDTPLPIVANGHMSSEETIDLEELASKRTGGGGMIDSVANMANSILGAGISTLRCFIILWFTLELF